ncbi:MAG: hypothetical protein HKO07_03690, partial [Pseudomonadales bacterium]|nr:hypothetical protein [Pseudomonadales bacterium]
MKRELSTVNENTSNVKPAAGDTSATGIAAPPRRRVPVWAIVLITMLLTALATVLVYRYFFAPKPFDAVELSEREQQQLDAKLDRLLPGRQSSAPTEAGSTQP